MQSASTSSTPCNVTGTAFITGGASGIGRGIAFAYAQHGINNIALVDINADALDATHAELKARYPHVHVQGFRTDVCDEDQVAATVAAVVEQFGRIDISVHAAGIAHVPELTHELPAKTWRRVIDVNQTGVFLCEKAVIKQMLRQEPARADVQALKGTIVNVSSIYGVKAPGVETPLAAYVASKHAVIGLTKLDAKLYAKQGIRINAVCPGFVFGTALSGPSQEAVLAEIGRTPLGRAAAVEEVGNAVLFLTSPMASYVHGAALMVDGGFVL